VLHNNNQQKLILRLKGGVGNQLFQYAFARSLCLQLNYTLIIDTKTGFIFDKYQRTPRIDDLLKAYNEATFTHYVLFYFTKFFPSISYRLFKSKRVVEKSTSNLVDQRSFMLSSDEKYLFVEGYFQSPDYFSSITTILKEEIQFPLYQDSVIQKYTEEINYSESVAIHVRRVAYDDTLAISYYEAAIEKMRTTNASLTFFVFSDDIAWSKIAFQHINNIRFIVHDKKDELVDLFLITRCKHFIIANSSFSWWGAYLSKANNKTVIAPKNTSIGVANHFYLDNWVLI
jgi:hypothetical protein